MPQEDLYRVDPSHTSDTVRFEPGNDTLNKESIAKICSAVVMEAQGMEFRASVTQLDNESAEVNMYLSDAFETEEGSHLLGKSIVSLNEDILVGGIIDKPLDGVRAAIREILDRR